MNVESVAKGYFLLSRDGAIATVAVNRPESRNAMNTIMWRDIALVMKALGEDKEVKVIVLRGAGKSFIAGADIKEFQEIAGDREKSTQYLRFVEGAMASVERLEQPVIALVNGPAFGGGCELCVACDLRYAADTAQFGIPACRLGIVITFQDTQRLALLVGAASAREILLTGKAYSAQEALNIGLVNGVLPSDKLEEFVYSLAREMTQSAPLTLRAAKVFARAALTQPRPLRVDDGLARSVQAFTSQDFREGVRAFMEKRKPQFQGR